MLLEDLQLPHESGKVVDIFDTSKWFWTGENYKKSRFRRVLMKLLTAVESEVLIAMHLNLDSFRSPLPRPKRALVSSAVRNRVNQQTVAMGYDPSRGAPS